MMRAIQVRWHPRLELHLEILALRTPRSKRKVDPSFHMRCSFEQIKEMEGQVREITGDENATIPS